MVYYVDSDVINKIKYSITRRGQWCYQQNKIFNHMLVYYLSWVKHIFLLPRVKLVSYFICYYLCIFADRTNFFFAVGIYSSYRLQWCVLLHADGASCYNWPWRNMARSWRRAHLTKYALHYTSVSFIKCLTDILSWATNYYQ